MKFRFHLLILTMVSVIASCGHKGKELSEYKNTSTGDSLLYYYVQMKAREYWERATNDTALRSRQQRDIFLKGVENGISQVTDDDNYNMGLRLGIRLAYNLREFEKKYDVDLNDDILIESLRNGLEDESQMPALEDQKEFYRLLDKMKTILKNKKRGEADKALAKEASARGLVKLSDKLYYKIVRKGTGENVKNGDVINIAADYERTSGDNLGLPSPITVSVGDSELPKVMDLAYKQLNHGATAVFATTAYSLFGSRTSIMGLEDDEIVFVSMILNDIVSHREE